MCLVFGLRLCPKMLGSLFFFHYISYQVLANDTLFTIANDAYQGLTTCRALMRENPHITFETLNVDVNVNVPLRCACPTPNQTASGLKYLLTYMCLGCWKGVWGRLPIIFQIFGYVLHVQDLSESVLICLDFCFLHILC